MEPKYKIGDFLYLKQDVENWKGNDTFGDPKFRKLLVIGILTETCYGGIQIHYLFRTYGSKGGTDLARISEIELTDTVEFKKKGE